MLFKVTDDPLDPRELERELDKPENGAVVTFQGVVRNHSRGRTVSYLEYDAYAPMATKVMAQIAEEIKARWPITDIGIWHRTGRLEIGETSLLVVVTSGHRKEAFEACHHAVDRIKEIVPVWKKEVWDNGESWVEGDVLVAGGDACSEEAPAKPKRRRLTKEEKKAADHAAFLRSGGSWDPDYAEEFKKYIYEARRLGSREPVDDLPD